MRRTGRLLENKCVNVSPPKTGVFHRLLYKIYQSIITNHTFHDTTTISYQTWIVCIMRPSRFDQVKECSPIENIPHAAEKKGCGKKGCDPLMSYTLRDEMPLQ